MDNHDDSIARQPRGQFNSAPERQRIRWAAETFASRERYSEERKQRRAAWGYWIGIFVPVAALALTLVRTVFFKG